MHEGGLGKLGALAFFSYCHFVIFLLFFLRDFFFFLLPMKNMSPNYSNFSHFYLNQQQPVLYYILSIVFTFTYQVMLLN